MEIERWHELEELFEQALALSQEEREAFMDRAAGHDRALRKKLAALVRAAETSGDFLERPAVTGALGFDAAPAEPRHIGPYRPLRRLGEGGMSQVYLAVRDDDEYQKLVAVKVIGHGMYESLERRFRTERQILAVLDHPNIARLLDGGRTEDGLPYFVMDYVEGVPVEEYCDRNRLTISQRLELFRTICITVHYAHQNLVVHRDIKPSNILITADGVPKLLDFGIAKLLKPEQFPVTVELTVTRLRPMTPKYASPEQFQGKPITTASDVYALGVLLYKLLAGHLPYRLSGTGVREIERAVVEQEPEPPRTAISRAAPAGSEAIAGGERHGEAIARSRRTTLPQLRRQLAGDLGNIVLTALRKEPARRYVSAAQFAEDVRRYQAQLPVMAHRDSLRYRVKKFLARNRVAVTVGAGFLLLLLGFAVSMAIQASRIAHERDQVEQERDQSEQVLAFLQDMFEQSDPFEAGEEAIIARQLLDRGAQRAQRELADRPRTQAALMQTIGDVYRNLGLYDSAAPLLEKALAIRRDTLGNEHPDVADSLDGLGELLRGKGDLAGAEPLLREALTLRRRLFGDDHPRVAPSLLALGRLKREMAEHAEAEELLREALAIQDADNAVAERAELLTELAIVLERSGNLEQAGPMFRQALELQRRALGDEHPLIAQSLNNLGVFQATTGDLAGAELLFREALEIRRKLLGNDHQDVGESLFNLGRVLKEKNQDFVSAEAMYREAMQIYRRIDRDHPSASLITTNLAMMLEDKGNHDAAESLFLQALAAQRRRLGPDHWNVGSSLKGLAIVHLSKGEPEQAETLLREALGVFNAALPEDHWRIAEVNSLLGGCLASLGRSEEAEPLSISGYQGLRENLGEEHPQTRAALERLIELYETLGREEQADEYRALRVPGAE